MDFLDELTQHVLPGDGAMGTELLAAGVPAGQCLEHLCLTQPDLVRGIHEQYIAAGARVIETNSFGANAVRLARHGLEGHVNELNWTAAQLAKDAAKGTGVYVAGSVGPLGITAAEAQGIDREEAFREQIGALLDGGCNLIILETFLDLEELKIAIYAKNSLHHCPVIALLAAGDSGPLARAAALEDAADVIGVNCVDAATALNLISSPLTRADGESPTLAAFPSAGLPEKSGDQLVYHTTPEEFAAGSLALVDRGARLIGGCCGIGPRHIKALAAALEARQSAK
jgi:homocysteine S-methyltransferase